MRGARRSGIEVRPPPGPGGWSASHDGGESLTASEGIGVSACGEPVREHVVTSLGEDTFGVELNALDGK